MEKILPFCFQKQEAGFLSVVAAGRSVVRSFDVVFRSVQHRRRRRRRKANALWANVCCFVRSFVLDSSSLLFSSPPIPTRKKMKSEKSLVIIFLLLLLLNAIFLYIYTTEIWSVTLLTFTCEVSWVSVWVGHLPSVCRNVNFFPFFIGRLRLSLCEWEVEVTRHDWVTLSFFSFRNLPLSLTTYFKCVGPIERKKEKGILKRGNFEGRTLGKNALKWFRVLRLSLSCSCFTTGGPN